VDLFAFSLSCKRIYVLLRAVATNKPMDYFWEVIREREFFFELKLLRKFFTVSYVQKNNNDIYASYVGFRNAIRYLYKEIELCRSIIIHILRIITSETKAYVDDYFKTAIVKGNLRVINFLLKAKCHFATSIGNTGTLWYAVDTNSQKALKFLLEAELNPNVHARCPLYHAVKKNNVECVKLLLRYGANPNEREWNGESPINLALSEKQLDCVNLLLSYGALRPPPRLNHGSMSRNNKMNE
jgi:hypothetical protein